MADAEAEPVNGNQELPSDTALSMEEEEKRELEEKKKAREPPIVYKDLVDVSNYIFFILQCKENVIYVNR